MSEDYIDDKLQRMISESRIEMPFEDFETDVMIQIRTQIQRRRSVFRNLKLSWLFFGLGIITGMSLTVYLSGMEGAILGIEAERLIIPLIFCLSLIILLLMEKLVKFSLFSSNR